MSNAPRKSWYGDGRQPWDDIVDAGWAPEFCAGNVLKYLRRDKTPEHSLESARWYHAQLVEMSRGKLLPQLVGLKPESHRQRVVGRACAVLVGLQEMLTTEEKEKLRE